MSFPVALKIHCEHREGERCVAGHGGGTPTPGACELCKMREWPDAAAPAVVWTDTGPMARELWPAWATWLAARAEPQDRGVGDTIERLLGKGGVAFKASWAATFGLLGWSCGCEDRQATWNASYPYGSG